MSGTLQATHVDDITPEIIAQEALTVLQAELHLARNVTKESELVSGVPSAVKMGDVIKVPKTGAVTRHAKDPGGDVLLQQPSMSSVPITIDQHWEVTIAPEDVAQAVVDRNIQDTYLGDMIRALAEGIETDLAAEFANFSNDPIDGTGWANQGDAEASVLAARALLTQQRAPRTGRFGYWESGAINTLLQEKRFTEVESYGANVAIQDGELGTIHGFKSFESIFVPDDGGSPAEYSNALMHRRALCLAMRPLPTPRGGGVKVSVVTDPVSGLTMRVLYAYNATKLADQITLDVLYGVGTLMENWGVVINTD